MAREFHYADYIIFGISIVVSISIGVYYGCTGGKQRTNFEYLLGNRSMKIFPVTISLLVSVESSVMMLGFPAEIYTYGFMFSLHLIMFIVGMSLTGLLVVPIIHRLQLTSVYEYLELRFKSRWLRKLGSTLALVNTIMYLGVVLLGPSLAMQAVLGFPLVWSMSIVSAASVIYTTIGGYKAVVWTDVFQAVIMFTGVFAVIIKGTMESGGVTEVFRLNQEGGRLDLWNFDPNPTVRHTFWSLMVGGFFQVLSLAVNQSSMQRISSIQNLKDAQKVMYFVGPIFTVTIVLASTEGLVAFAYYSKTGCDPLAAKQITNPNQIIPYFVLDLFQSLPGMPGLFMAALFSASLSTLSSGYSSLSAQIVEDFIVPITNLKSESIKATIAKLSVVVCGLLAVAMSIIFSNIGGSLIQMVFSVTGVFAGAVTGLIVFAIIFPGGEALGAVIGTVCSVGFTLWIALGSVTSPTLIKTPPLPPAPVVNCSITNNTVSPYSYTLNSLQKIQDFSYYQPQGLDRLYSISYLWFGVIATVTVILVGSVVSCIAGCTCMKHNKSQSKYVYSVAICDELCCCLPEVILKFFRCENSNQTVEETDGQLKYPEVSVVESYKFVEKGPETDKQMKYCRDDHHYRNPENTKL